jgi:lipopolysaccharide biosynthesis glycosyltransferase
MLRVFIGVDPRSPLSYTVLQSSIIRRSSVPVQITPLLLNQLPMSRVGLTEFTYSRYIVPHLCNYEGWAMFIDADMVCLTDINEVFELAKDNGDAVSLVKHDMRFEWPSLMVFNNEKCKKLTPEYIETESPAKMEWAESVGELPHEYNHLVGYDEPNPEAKIVHYTQGVPCWHETEDCEFADEWKAEKEAALMTCTWKDLMGNSVHAKPVLEKLFRGYQEAMKA